MCAECMCRTTSVYIVFNDFIIITIMGPYVIPFPAQNPSTRAPLPNPCATNNQRPISMHKRGYLCHLSCSPPIQRRNSTSSSKEPSSINIHSQTNQSCPPANPLSTNIKHRARMTPIRIKSHALRSPRRPIHLRSNMIIAQKMRRPSRSARAPRSCRSWGLALRWVFDAAADAI